MDTTSPYKNINIKHLGYDISFSCLYEDVDEKSQFVKDIITRIHNQVQPKIQRFVDYQRQTYGKTIEEIERDLIAKYQSSLVTGKYELEDITNQLKYLKLEVIKKQQELKSIKKQYKFLNLIWLFFTGAPYKNYSENI